MQLWVLTFLGHHKNWQKAASSNTQKRKTITKKTGSGPHGQIRDSGPLHRTGSQECLRNLAEKIPVVSLLAWLHMFFPHSLRAYLPGNKIEFTPATAIPAIHRARKLKSNRVHKTIWWLGDGATNQYIYIYIYIDIWRHGHICWICLYIGLLIHVWHYESNVEWQVTE